MQPKVYTVPKEIDEGVAELKLKSMGINIDKLTAEQQEVPVNVGNGNHLIHEVVEYHGKL